MDHLDAAILREVLRNRALLWGGGDPRIGMSSLADRLGVDRTTVWARLKAWREAGFLVRNEVVPNPSLLGSGLAVGEIRIEDPRRKPEVLEALRLVEGVLGGADQVGPYVLLLYAHESPAALDRCTRLIGRLESVDEVSICIPFEPPRSSIQPAPTDWRILAALRQLPDAPMRDVAREAGVSARTFRRRYGELLQANAVWWFPVFDFTRYRGAVLVRFIVGLQRAEDVPALVDTCRHHLPQMILWNAHTGSPGPVWVEVHCHLGAAAEVEAWHAWLLDQSTADTVEVYFPKSWFVLPTWFDERIAKQVPAPSPGRGDV